MPTPCPDCGFEGPDGARFCAGCGRALPSACAACGVELVAGARFCHACGSPVAGATATAPSDAPSARGAADPLERRDRALRAAVQEVERILPGAGDYAPVTSERRQVTILFADLVGSTRLGEGIDPEDLAEIVGAVLAIMTRAVVDAGGHVGRLMGDGILAFFGAPVSHEDDALRAIRAAVAIRDEVRAYGERLADEGGPAVEVRVGLDTGLVVVGQFGGKEHGEYTTLGDAANTAARMQGAAPPGEIYLSEETAHVVGGAVGLEDAGPQAMKGKQEPVPAFRVVGAAPAPGTAPRGLAGVEAPLVGREAELARLHAVLREAREAPGAAWVTLVGEAGVGKSRLTADFAREAEVALRLRARAIAERGDAYSLVRALLRERFESDASSGDGEAWLHGLRDDLCTLPSDDADRRARDLLRLLRGEARDDEDARAAAERGLAGLEAWLGCLARRGPLLLVLEDLHWADEASLDAIPRLVDALRDAPALVLANARPSLYGRRPNWGEGEASHRRVDLDRLGRGGTERLLAALFQVDEAAAVPPALRSFVRERSEGNPYYVEELVRMLIARGIARRDDGAWQVDAEALEAGRVPATLSGMLQARLDGLPPASKRLLMRASVLGRSFWPGALAALGERRAASAESELASLREQGLVLARHRSSLAGLREYQFRHALLRDAAYAMLLRRDRPGLHAAAAAWLDEQAGEERGEWAARIAAHYVAGEQPERAAGPFLEAAARERAAYANEQAARYYSRALDCLPEPDRARRAEALIGRERVRDLAGDREGQREDLDAMAALAGEGGPPSPSYVHFRRSWLAVRTGEPERAEAEARRALEAAESDAERADALQNLGNALSRLGRKEAAERAFREALAIREGEGDELGAAKSLMGAATAARDLERFAEAERDFRTALAAYRRLDQPRDEAVATTNLAVTLAMQGDLDAAGPLLHEALELYRRAGDRNGEATAEHNLGYLAMEQDHPETGLEAFDRAVAICRTIGNDGSLAESLKERARALDALGEARKAEEARAEAARITEA